MAYDRPLAHRVTALLDSKRDLTARALFGGYGYFLNRVMFACVWRDCVLVKLYDGFDDALLEPHTSGFDPMDTGKPMTGWVVVAAPGIDTDEKLAAWLDRAVAAIPKRAKKKPSRRG